jgi:NAD(P)-dependent dehydrogenase (short-subunit alcohol dehydrogenase family)
MPVALITGASRGFGRALAEGLADAGWSLVLDARGRVELASVTNELAEMTGVVSITGDVADPAHRHELVDRVAELGGLDLLVNNASRLGPSPQPALRDYPPEELRRVYEVNVVAPLALCQALLPLLEASSGGTIVNLSSDAAVEAYPGWGGYGSSKAALDQWSAVLAAEHPALRVYAFDPGDMRTDMHQQAFPGEDISDRPEPATVVPALLRLLSERPDSGRYRAADLAVPLVRPVQPAGHAGGGAA